MNKRLLTRGAAIGSSLAVSLVMLAPAGMASAQSNTSAQKFQANLKQLNKSGASGTLTATLDGNKLTVNEHVNGVLKGQPHAQHLHFSSSASHTCPTAAVIADNKPGGANDKPFAYGNNKVIESVEARPAYGPPVISMTTGDYDSSAKAALAVKHFPTAKDGTIDYTRTFKLNSDQVKHLKANEFVVVVHGLDLNGDGQYDIFGNTTKEKNASTSALAKAAGMTDPFPLEGTAPASCGVLTAMPTGAPETGSGSTAGMENTDLLAMGGAALIAAGAVFGLRKREALSRQ
jgi:LPXTG-motif cell wall-anchored protein